MSTFVVAALYKFAPLTGLPALQTALQKVCDDNGVCGTLLLAHEGINGTIAGTATASTRCLLPSAAQNGFGDLEHKESSAQAPCLSTA